MGKSCPLVSWNVIPLKQMNSLSRGLAAAVVCSFYALSCPGQQPTAPIATRPAPPTPEMKQMQHIEDMWDDALAKKDQYGLELVLSPQFIDISSTGDVTTRNQNIARLFL